MVIITSFTPPVDGILYHEAGCELIVDNQSAGMGDLYVTESCVMWSAGQNSSVTLAYRQISLHAVQRTPSPLIYMMIDYKLTLPGQQQQSENEDPEYDPDEMPCTEIKLVPQNETSLTAIYEALNTGQSLHPDPDDSVSEDDFMIAEDTEENQSEDAATRLQGLSIQQPNGNGFASDDDDGECDQFADA